MKICLLRHGTTQWNQERRIQGGTDIPLDEAGEELARATGKALLSQGVHFDRILSSPLSRSKRTAQLIAPGLPIETDERLRELNFGAFEGQSVVQLQGDKACPFRYFHSDPGRYDAALRQLEKERPGEGFESLTTLCQRTKSFLEEVLTPLVLEETQERQLLIAGHGAMNQALMMAFTKRTDTATFWSRGLQPNCGFYEIYARPDGKGGVLYETDEKCQVCIDPASFGVPGLL